MKRAFLFALIFAGLAAGATVADEAALNSPENSREGHYWSHARRSQQPRQVQQVQQNRLQPARNSAKTAAVVTRTAAITKTTRTIVTVCPVNPPQPPPSVAEQVSNATLAHPVREAEGVIPRLLTAPDPAQMINPFAPPEYGSAQTLVTYTDRDPYRTSNENKRRFQTDGIRLLTLRPLW